MKFLLKCCGKTDPVGVDKLNIRLTFSTDGSIAVRSYQVLLWNAEGPVCTVEGQAKDGFTVRVDPTYLQDAAGYNWRVQVWLTDGTTVISEPAYFETGISQWEGQWIGGDAPEGQVLAFKKEFDLDQLPQKARLYITGLGWFSPELNGRSLDGSYFIPPVTDYTPRPQVDSAHISTGHQISYYTYDVTDILRQGRNILYAEVAGGYYSNREKLNFEPQPDFAFGEPCLIYELHLQDENGTVTKLCSSTDTQVRCTNKIAQLYSGDVIDFTKAPAEYKPARLVAAPTGELTAPECEADSLSQCLSPVRSWQTPEGTVYDFGVNHSGGLQFVAQAAEETELVIRFAEVLRADGTLNFETGAWHGKHNDTAEKKHIYQQNTYRLKKGKNEIAPKFSWFCYRYALIPSGEKVNISELKSLFIHMDLKHDGSFRCGEELLNRINETFIQTLFCNMHSGLLTDCPHRERLPYTGDGKLVMRSACYNLDMVDFYYKWFRDILNAQTTEGLIPNSAPYFGGGGGYAWGNALCTVSKNLYAFTGDKNVAQECYTAITKWLEYYSSKADKDHIIRSNSHSWMLGDWLAPDVVTSDVYYISTVCYLQAAKTAAFFAGIVAPEQCQKWQTLIENITSGINRVFFREQSCGYGNGVQGENMLALAENIVPEKYRQQMNDQLQHHYLVETDGHLDTGIVLTPVLLDYLTDRGYQDIAWRIITARTYPSYFNLMEGDTTFCEHWSKKWPDYYFSENGNSRFVKGGGELSHCHPMYGSVAAWLYEKVAGLDLSQLYRQIVLITPCFMAYLPWAEARKKTPFGEAGVHWSRENDVIKLNLTIPQGLTAQCQFPAVCKCLTDLATNQTYYPDQDGYFRFSMKSGQWRLTCLNGEDRE